MSDDELRALGDYLESRQMERSEVLLMLARAMGATIRASVSDMEQRRYVMDRMTVAAEVSAGLIEVDPSNEKARH